MLSWLKKLFNSPAAQCVSDDAEIELFFTDAEEARETFDGLISAPHMTRKLLIIHGIGGVGKSTLLRMYRLTCRRRDISAALVSGEEVASPVDLLAGWATELSAGGAHLPEFHASAKRIRALQVKVEHQLDKAGETLKAQLADRVGKAAVDTVASMIPGVGPLFNALGGLGVDWLRTFLSKDDLEFFLDPTALLTTAFLSDAREFSASRRYVLMVDTYEQLPTLDDWLRDLIRQAPGNTLFVLAGRCLPNWDRSWQGWMGQAAIVQQKEMSAADLEVLVRRYYNHIHSGTPEPRQVAEIVGFARGLPIAATTVVQLWVKHDMEDFQAVRPQVVSDLADRLLEGVPLVIRPAFEAAAVLRHFNADVLGVLLNQHDANELFAELRRWPFIRPRREGLAVHDSMREMMNEALQVRTPERLRELHEKAASYYEVMAERNLGEERERFTREYLYHRVCSDEPAGIHAFRQVAERAARHRLLLALAALLKDAATYPLKQMTSQQWRAYYNARLDHLSEKWDEAEQVFEQLCSSSSTEPEVRAYALCDLGRIQSTLRSRPFGGAAKAVHSIERAFQLIPMDSKLVEGYEALAHLYQFRGDWNQAEGALNTKLSYHQSVDDHAGQLLAHFELRWHHTLRGDWGKALEHDHEVLDLLPKVIGGDQILQRRLFSGGSTLLWAGKYQQAEERFRADVDPAVEHAHSVQRADRVCWLAFALAHENRFEEAMRLISECVAVDRDESCSTSGRQHYRGVWYGLWGASYVQAGNFESARTYLNRSLEIKREIEDVLGIPEVLVWTGRLYEVCQEWASATEAYRLCLEQYHRLGRLYFECGAYVGLARAVYSRGDDPGCRAALSKAKNLATQHGYNDHLASVWHLEGHMAWNSSDVSDEKRCFQDALRRFKRAMRCALQYNRYVLDEILSGRPEGTPLEPIIPRCQRASGDGVRMLQSLSKWWCSRDGRVVGSRDKNASGASLRSPADIERVARELEPGDGASQKTVVEQIEGAISQMGC